MPYEAYIGYLERIPRAALLSVLYIVVGSLSFSAVADDTRSEWAALPLMSGNFPGMCIRDLAQCPNPFSGVPARAVPSIHTGRPPGIPSYAKTR